MPAFVLDSSVAGAWVLPDERTAQSEALAENLANSGAVAPILLIYEVRNLLVSAIRRGRLDADTAVKSMAEFRLLPITYSEPSLDEPVLKLAGIHRLSAYDAAFLALAKERTLPMATFDSKLRDAATLEAVKILP